MIRLQNRIAVPIVAEADMPESGPLFESSKPENGEEDEGLWAKLPQPDEHEPTDERGLASQHTDAKLQP